MQSLKELRIENNASQKSCAQILGVSLRSYKDYENDESKKDTIKYNYMLEKLNGYFEITEEKGILTLDQIIKITKPLFEEYKIEYCYLFGSYAKNLAKENSDIDLLISESLNGLKYYEFVEVLREKLHKKIDLLDISQLTNNKELLNEILLSGVKIYG